LSMKICNPVYDRHNKNSSFNEQMKCFKILL
jgi:hypothetical protein